MGAKIDKIMEILFKKVKNILFRAEVAFIPGIQW